jgi:ATP-dependent DNA ligase
MPLEVPSPLPPMEALSVEAIPEGGDWQYEPKWDGLFDLLAVDDGKALLSMPLRERRARLEQFSAQYFGKGGLIRLSPVTDKLAQAKKWLSQTGATLDGIIAKRRDLDYRAGERDGMQKIKNFRSADCVIGGFRYGGKSKAVGSLLLGLYDAEGLLHHVGFTSGIAAADRPALTKKLEKLIAPPGFTGSSPGGPSRWNQGKENTWQPHRGLLRPCHRQPLPPRYKTAALAARQVTCAMHDGSTRAEKVRFPQAAQIAGCSRSIFSASEWANVFVFS